VTCKVVYSSRSAAKKAKVRASAKAALVRNGRTYAKGRVSSLRATRKVTRGRYTLRIGSGARAASLTVTVR
jgi:hypothetical protein